MKTKSPLKANPLRLPGQSLQKQIDDYFEEQMLFPYMMALLTVMWAGYEWAIFLEYMKRPSPLMISIIAVGLVAYATWKVIRGRRKLKMLIQARDGERAVGQFLEDLRGQGHHVFHDVLGDGFNLDHVVIGPKGVFTVETKTISKPIKGEAKVSYDGADVRLGGYKPERNPIIQSKAQANWLKEFFLEETGKKVKVQPIVVYPGWFVESPKGANKEVWVLNPKALPTFICNNPEEIMSEEVHLLKSSLSRRIRKL